MDCFGSMVAKDNSVWSRCRQLGHSSISCLQSMPLLSTAGVDYRYLTLPGCSLTPRTGVHQCACSGSLSHKFSLGMWCFRSLKSQRHIAISVKEVTLVLEEETAFLSGM